LQVPEAASLENSSSLPYELLWHTQGRRKVRGKKEDGCGSGKTSPHSFSLAFFS